MNHKHLFIELKKGIKETSKYILSHHKEEEYYKCYLLKIKSSHLVICARCLGIYLGVIIGILIFTLQILNKNLYYFSIAILPTFALVEWSISSFTKIKSNNLLRTSSGIFLGVAYAFALILFFRIFPNYFIICIGFFYLTITFLLIARKFSKLKC